MGATPNIPLYYSHSENGMYYYISSCCVTEYHYGLIASAYPLQPFELGCHPPTPIEGPTSEIEAVPGGGVARAAAPVNVEIDQIMGNGNIRNSDPGPSPFHCNPVGIRMVESHLVSFNGLGERVYRLRTFTMDLYRDATHIQSTYRIAVYRSAGRETEIQLTDVVYSGAYPAAAPVVKQGRLITGKNPTGERIFILNNVM